MTGYTGPLQPGDNLSLTCTAQPSDNFNWTFTPYGGSPGPVAFGQSFSKQHLQESDAGTYACAYRNRMFDGAASVVVEIRTGTISPESHEPSPKASVTGNYVTTVSQGEC